MRTDTAAAVAVIVFVCILVLLILGLVLPKKGGRTGKGSRGSGGNSMRGIETDCPYCRGSKVQRRSCQRPRPGEDHSRRK